MTDPNGNVKEFEFNRLGYPLQIREFTRGLSEGKSDKKPGETEAQYRLRVAAVDEVTAQAKAIMQDGKSLPLKSIPLGTLATIRNDSGPAIVNHYNLYPSAEINGATAPGTTMTD